MANNSSLTILVIEIIDLAVLAHRQELNTSVVILSFSV